MEREVFIDLTTVGIVVLCIAVTAVTVWWSAYCHRRFCRR